MIEFTFLQDDPDTFEIYSLSKLLEDKNASLIAQDDKWQYYQLSTEEFVKVDREEVLNYLREKDREEEDVLQDPNKNEYR